MKRNKMNIMKHSDDINTRAIAMWSVISRFVDFRGKSVFDLGCGGGDFIWRSHVAGAYKVTGIDYYSMATKSVEVRVQHTKHGTKSVGTVETIREDLNLMKPEWKADIALCCSVLPYLDDPANFVLWMSKQFDLSVVECQYAGDGPGFDFIRNTSDMKFWLGDTFDSVTLIGSSYLVAKDIYRDIWMCKNDL